MFPQYMHNDYFSMHATSKWLKSLQSKKTNYLKFGIRKICRKSIINFDYRIVDGKLNFRIACSYFTNLKNNPPSMKTHSRDQNLIQYDGY